jgi:hypothetical protein
MRISYSPNLRENDWDPSQWIPLIDSNKTLLPWLVKQPTDAERGRARHVSKEVVISSIASPLKILCNLDS